MNNKLNEIHWIDLPSQEDSRGVLTSVEENKTIPFNIKRIFYMHHIRSDRGGHAHIDTDQVVIAAAGSFTMDLTNNLKNNSNNDGETKTRYLLNDPCKGLYIPRMTFLDIKNISADAICLVLASTHYDMNMSLRSWDDYKAYRLSNNNAH